MGLLDNISISNTPAAAPSAKWAGRPAKPCTKCKSTRHWINKMGGIQCLSCNPPPSDLTDDELKTRFIDSGMGTWDAYSDFLHGNPREIRLAKASGSAAAGPTGSQGSAQHPQGNRVSNLDPSACINVFVDATPTGACLRDSETGEFIFQSCSSQFKPWLPDELELVEWIVELTGGRDPSNPQGETSRLANSPQALRAASRLSGVRLSRWEVITDGHKFLTDLRAQALIGHDGPRNCYGGFMDDLRRFYGWFVYEFNDTTFNIEEFGGSRTERASDSVVTQATTTTSAQPVDLSSLSLF